jgi:hypothetical protein
MANPVKPKEEILFHSKSGENPAALGNMGEALTQKLKRSKGADVPTAEKDFSLDQGEES